jgi:2'-5' RNA ligase
LAVQLGPYRKVHDAVRWTQPQTWHLTLLFMGSVDPSWSVGLETLIDRVARRSRPYRVSIAGGDGRLRQGVAWLRVVEGAGQLIAMADAVAVGQPSGLTGGPPPKRTPAAHLTVARKADKTAIAALRHESLGPLSAAWTVDRIVLVRSHLGPDGARYETLHEATL